MGVAWERREDRPFHALFDIFSIGPLVVNARTIDLPGVENIFAAAFLGKEQ